MKLFVIFPRFYSRVTFLKTQTNLERYSTNRLLKSSTTEYFCEQSRVISFSCSFQKAATQKPDLTKWLRNFEKASNSNVAAVIQSSLKSGRLNHALQLFEFQRSRNADFYVNSSIKTQMITALLDEDRLEEAKDFMKSMHVKSTDLIKIFKSLESKGVSHAVIEEIFDSLNLRLSELENLMRSQTNFGDIDGALQLFERIVDKFHKTVHARVLMRKLIESENVKGLDKVMEISTRIHGRKNCTISMGIAFSEANQMDKAKEMFTSLSIDDNETMLSKSIDFCKEKKQIKELQNLLEALEDCDLPLTKEKIYTSLLELFESARDRNQLTAVVLRMKNEGIVPNEKHRNKMIVLLRRNEVEIPDSWRHQAQWKFRDEMNSYLNSDKLDEANTLFCKLLKEKEPVPDNVIHFVLLINASNGNVTLFNDLRGIFDATTKEHLTFSHYECLAYRKANQCKEYVEVLRDEFNRDDVDLNSMKNFPNDIIELMTQDPDVYDSVKTLAIDLAEKGLLKKICIVWTYNFMKQVNAPDNEAIWKKYFETKSTFICSMIPKLLFHRQEIDRLREFLNLSEMDKRYVDRLLLGCSYSYLFSGMIMHGNNYDSVIVEMKNAAKYISNQHLRQETLDIINKGPCEFVNEFFSVFNKY